MDSDKKDFSLEMPKVGVIRGVLARDIEVVGERIVNLRTCARPYKNVYTVAQLRELKHIMEDHGSGKVHLSPRHNLEIPEVRLKDLDTVLRKLFITGLFPGGAGTSVRNIFTCPDWCESSIRPVQEIGVMVASHFADRDMPNKVTISFAGCPNGCSRPHNSDIGIIGVGRVKVTSKTCPEGCDECIKICKVKAVEKREGVIYINDKCIFCCKCVYACKEEGLQIEETGFQVLIGGKEGSSVLFGEEYAIFARDFDVLEIIEKTLGNYQKKVSLRPGSTRKKERLGEVVRRLGLTKFMEN